MSVFVVLALKESSTSLSAKISGEINENAFYHLKEDAWLIDYDGTTQTLADRLGIRQGNTGPGIILLVANYSGRASPDIWEWLKERIVGRTG